MKIGFDIGGVLSKYPKEFLKLLKTFHYGYDIELFIIIDDFI